MIWQAWNEDAGLDYFFKEMEAPIDNVWAEIGRYPDTTRNELLKIEEAVMVLPEMPLFDPIPKLGQPAEALENVREPAAKISG